MNAPAFPPSCLLPGRAAVNTGRRVHTAHPPSGLCDTANPRHRGGPAAFRFLFKEAPRILRVWEQANLAGRCVQKYPISLLCPELFLFSSMHSLATATARKPGDVQNQSSFPVYQC